MKLQIIVPHYKESEELVRVFLDSVAAQRFVDFKEFEVVIINDGDECTLPVKIFEEYSFPIRYLIKPWGGPSETRQFGQDFATAKFVMFCDCDDLFGSVDAIWQIFQKIDADNADLICSSYLRDDIRPDGTWSLNHYKADRVKTMVMIHGKVFRTSFLKDHKIYWAADLKTRHEDFFFYSQVLAEGPRTAFIDKDIYIWKYRIGSLSDERQMCMEEQEIDRAEVELRVLGELKQRKAEYSFKLKLIDLLFNTYCYYTYADKYNRKEQVLDIATRTYKTYIKDLEVITQKDIVDRISVLCPGILYKILFHEFSFSSWLTLLSRR